MKKLKDNGGVIMSKQMENYGNDSIVLLKGAARVREKPAVIFGSDGIEGCEHSFFEIVSNSIDEAREGFGNIIEIRRYKDGSLSVKDYGRGIPLDFNSKENRYNWELVYCELYAGGKMNNSNYDFALGLNGLGACATQYASEYFDVEVCRDGYIYNLHFEKGENIGGLKKEKCDKLKGKQSGEGNDQTKSYSFQKWKPDRDVFTETEISLEYLQTVLTQQAIVNENITFKLFDEITGFEGEFACPEGILGHVKESCKTGLLSTPVMFEKEGSGKDRSDKNEYKVKAKIAFCFSNDSTALEYFHNSSYLENGGSPDKAIRSAMVQAFDKAITARNKYNKGESKVSFADIQDSLFYISSTFSTETSYANQTKKAITNKFIQEFLTSSIISYMEIWFVENKSEGDKVIEQVLANKRSRESAEKQRLNIKKKIMGSIDSINNQVKKFVDCRSKDVNKRELYIVEGDSALGSCKMGRDAEFQGIMPVRGKILNCLKSDVNKIFSSDIITDLMKVLGCGVQISKKKYKDVPDFDINKLRWNKVIICTDADIDGYQIRTLILTMIYRLAPKLLDEGKVFIAETPLFEIVYKSKGKTQTFFAFDEKEKAAILKGKNIANVTIQRSKGLGENDPDMMWQTTMCPETRRLIRVRTEDAAIMSSTFDLLLGDDLARRKEYIKSNGHLYLENLDL